MPILNLKPTHKPVREYYKELKQFEKLGVSHEGAVKTAFQKLLESCGKQFNWTLVQEYQIKRPGKRPARVDGALVDDFGLTHGYWEAKDSDDDLAREVKKKFQDGYPKDNIIFQAPERVILYQDGKQVEDADITQAEVLVDVLGRFFNYRPPAYEQWEKASEDFKRRVPELGAGLQKLIAQQRKINPRFIQAFADFALLCKQSINPNVSESAIEEMLIQHLLTERVFRTVFNNPDFTRRNVIAVEIEKVIDALTSKAFSRQAFLESLDYFYRAVEETAATISDFSQKQTFLNAIYEKFFQGFSMKVADTHGIVYTPQPIVNFMVKSVEDILQREFGKSLSDKGVHILDPFVGTGNFIVRVMQEIRKTALPYKYEHELHCNEVMLLPYYIASMNIEHEYLELAGSYKPFDGVCLVDTFELAEEQQLSLFTAENTARVERQRQSPIFVIIGNPPYNANQVNEMDLNKNRQHKVLDERIKYTYIADSESVARTTRKLLFDPYVKAFRWATDRIGNEGVICFISNNSFIDQIAFDGMRKNLAKDFDAIYCLDLGGNVRKNPKISGTTHNVFGIQVGVSINILIKKRDLHKFSVYYASLDGFWRKEQKYKFLNEAVTYQNVQWDKLPTRKNIWLTEGLHLEYDNFLALASKKGKPSNLTTNNVIFKKYALGISTNKDAWLYNFRREDLERNVASFCETYNTELDRWRRAGRPRDLLNFLRSDEKSIKWSSLLLDKFKRDNYAEFDKARFRKSIYRPFTKQNLYFDKILIDAPTLQGIFFPSTFVEEENRVICLTGVAPEKPFMTLVSNKFADLHLSSPGCGTQCFPFYTYDEDGTNRLENITNWALEQFSTQYQDDAIAKWDIFHYVYAVLHHQQYRDRYAANLKRELPRIPFAPDFWAFANAGKRLAEIHVNYEQQPEYELQWLENRELPLDWRVEKMKLSKDKTQLIYNDFLTLNRIPPKAFEYRLGNRSALDWIIDQYQFKTDKRSGITNDPNRLEDEQYIVRLIGQVITVSLETVEIVNALPSLGIPES
jgi:predicted helicase